jgi:hypothetical protein
MIGEFMSCCIISGFCISCCCILQIINNEKKKHKWFGGQTLTSLQLNSQTVHTHTPEGSSSH